MNNKSKIRVLLLCTHPQQYTGYSKVVYELLNNLIKYPDLLITVYGFQKFNNNNKSEEDSQTFRKIESPNLFIYDAALNENPKDVGFGINNICDFVMINKPDIIFIYNDLFIITNFINQLNKIQPRFFKIITYIDQVYPFQKQRYINCINQHVDYSFVFTQYWKDVIKSENLLCPCDILKHGFNKEVFYPKDKMDARKAIEIEDLNSFIILNINRNQPRKRYDILLMAFAKFISKYPNDNIILLLGCNLEKEWDILEIFKRELYSYNKELNHLNYIRAIRNPQSSDDNYINNLYNACDIGINCCDGEGFGLCNFEHAGVGKPQIVPKLGGFLDFFNDDNSIMIKPKWRYYVDSSRDEIGGEANVCDPDDFTNAIEKYYNDKLLITHHGDKARQSILKYKWEEETMKIHKVFSDLV
jgi:glycosyltransferase involved in cell wall biosynthesis